MFRKLRARFGFQPTPSQTFPCHPIADDLLADEPGVSEDEVETCLREIRARRAAPPLDSSRTNMLLSLGAAEQFASECLEYGPENTHHAKLTHIAMAVQSWAAGRERDIHDPQGFLAALLTLLEFRGGHRGAVRGTDCFVGCRLNESAIAMLNGRAQLQMRTRQPQIGRIIGELLSG